MPHKKLPEELWLEVFTHLEPTDLSRAAQVCRHWSRLIGQSETLWKTQCLSVTNSETKQRMLMDKAGDEKCWRVSYVCVLNNVVLLIVTLVVHVSNPYGTKIQWLSVNRLQTKDPIHWLSVNYLQKSTGCLSTYRPKIHWLSVNYVWTKEPLVVFQLPTDQRATGCQLPTDQRSTGCLSTAYRPKNQFWWTRPKSLKKEKNLFTSAGKHQGLFEFLAHSSLCLLYYGGNLRKCISEDICGLSCGKIIRLSILCHILYAYSLASIPAVDFPGLKCFPVSWWKKYFPGKRLL